MTLNEKSVKVKNLLLKSKQLVSKSKNILAKNALCNEQNIPIDFHHKCKAWIDKETNLIWEIKTKENIKNLYTFEEAFKYAQELNERCHCCLTKWRVPSYEELKTLYSKTKNNNFYIKSVLSKNTDWAYWSAIEDEHNILNSYVFYYSDGTKRSESKFFKCYIRCVYEDKKLTNE